MPTLLEWKGWRFFFYSADGFEPAHVHARKGRQEVKFWLDDDCKVAAAQHVNERNIRALQGVTVEKRQEFLEAWHDHFGA